MGKITGRVIDIKPIDNSYCTLYVDADQVWGSDEIMELKLSNRLIEEVLEENAGIDIVNLLSAVENRKALIRKLQIRIVLKKE